MNPDPTSRPTDVRTPVHVTIAIATYRRPQGLARLLSSIERQTWCGQLSTIVVDNDVAQSAQETASRFAAQIPLKYVCEPQPGIAAARNRALRETPVCDAVAFIDDDEVADPRWLAELVAGISKYRTGIVAGPVISRMEDDAKSTPLWIRRYRPHDSPRYGTGTTIKWPATGNVMIRSSVLETLGPQPFDNAYGLTGGSDAALFWELRQRGFEAIWIDSAIAEEVIPRSRTKFSWWWRRCIKQGNVSSRLMQRERSRPAIFAIGIMRIAFGATIGVVGLIIPGSPSLLRFANLPKGIGTLRALRGKFYIEYARTSA